MKSNTQSGILRLLNLKAVAIAILALVLTVSSGAWLAVVSAAPPAPTTNLAAPTNLRVFTGGPDVALRWNASPDGKKYGVYRNNVRVGYATATTNSTYLTNGTVYYDVPTSADGATLQYKVRVENTTKAMSGFSNTVTISRPTLTAGPIVSIDASAATDIATYLQAGRSTIQSWYPKIAKELVGTNYTPLNSMLIKAENCSGIAYASGATITVCAAYARANPNDLGMFIHESIHIMQFYPAYTHDWITEGIADWARYSFYNDKDLTAPAADSTYQKSYATAGYFLQWVATTYDAPTLIADLNNAGHSGTYSDNIFVATTGKDIAGLWTQLTGNLVSNPGKIAGSGKCVDLQFYSTTPGNPLQIKGCENNSAQDAMIVYAPDASGYGQYRILNNCMVTAGSAVTDGARVVIGSCGLSTDQTRHWMHQADGTIVHRPSGKCLQPVNGVIGDNIVLEIYACNGSSAQVWSATPPAPATEL